MYVLARITYLAAGTGILLKDQCCVKDQAAKVHDRARDVRRDPAPRYYLELQS
jgi:hypothetical protein